MGKNNLSLATFGMQTDVEADASSARSYVLNMYGNKATFFPGPASDSPRLDNRQLASQLPPTEDAFKQHVLRERYQTSIWCKSHVAYPSLRSPVDNGWYLPDCQLEPVIYTKESAPQEVRDVTHIYCSDRDCRQPSKCHCLLNHLCCTEFCACRGDCQNTEAIVDCDRDNDNLD